MKCVDIVLGGGAVMPSPGCENTGNTTALCSTSLQRYLPRVNTGLTLSPTPLCLALPSPGCQDIPVALLLGLTECLPSFQGADPPGPGGAAEGAARRGHVHARRI